MGTVWRARHEDHGLDRTVAIKLIRRGMDSAHLLRRFHLERQILARLEHPHIARLYDAGAAEDGRPYLVMEYVDGLPIDRYCRDNELGLERILALFREVCGAVHFAHTHLVLHRDIKPGNVLVTHAGEVKLLDFGIAKGLSSDGAAVTGITEQGGRALTPRYASPEQIRGERLTTASDVYTLGVVLYELLTSCSPYERALSALRPPSSVDHSAGMPLASQGAVEQAVLLSEPVRPSLTCIQRSDLTLDQRRRMSRQVRGDLDWVVMRCLEKDPLRRYASAGELAEELGRILRHEAVLAGPPSLMYRTRKFLRRHRPAVLSATAGLLMLVVATSVSIAFGLSESRQRRLADDAGREARAQGAAAAERAAEAQRQAEIAEAVIAFLNDDLLGAAVPSVEPGKGRDVGLRAVLDTASTRIEQAAGPGGRLSGKPLVVARIRRTLGEAYGLLAEIELALAHLRTAHAQYAEALGPTQAATLGTARSIALLLRDNGRLDEAEPYLLALHEHYRAKDESSIETLGALHALGLLRQRKGQYAQARACYEAALEGRRRLLGARHADTLNTVNNLGALLQQMGLMDEAAPYFEAALEGRREAFGEGHPATLESLHNMGYLYDRLGRSAEAVAFYEDALAGRRRVFGEDHPVTMVTARNFAGLLSKIGRLEEAVELGRLALDSCRRRLGDGHPDTMNSCSQLGLILLRAKRPNEAEPLLREALEGRRRALGDEHPATISALSDFAGALQTAGRHLEALEHHEQALAARERVLGRDHPHTIGSLNNVGVVLLELGRSLEAAEALEQAIERARNALPAGQPDLAQYLGNAARALMALERYADAEAALLEAHGIVEGKLGANDARTQSVVRLIVALYETWPPPDGGLSAERAAGAVAGAAREALVEQWRARMVSDAATQPQGGAGGGAPP